MIAACDDHTLYTITDLLKPGHGGSTDRDEVISDLMHSMLNSVVCANDHSNRYNARQCEPGVSCLAYRRIWLAPKSKRKQADAVPNQSNNQNVNSLVRQRKG